MAQRKVVRKKVVYYKPNHYKDFLDEDAGGHVVGGPNKWHLMISTFDHWMFNGNRTVVFRFKPWNEAHKQQAIKGRIEAVEPIQLLKEHFSITFIPVDAEHQGRVFRFHYDSENRKGRYLVYNRKSIPLPVIDWGAPRFPGELLGD